MGTTLTPVTQWRGPLSRSISEHELFLKGTVGVLKIQRTETKRVFQRRPNAFTAQRIIRVRFTSLPLTFLWRNVIIEFRLNYVSNLTFYETNALNTSELFVRGFMNMN